jgi:hypothetical protein
MKNRDVVGFLLLAFESESEQDDDKTIGQSNASLIALLFFSSAPFAQSDASLFEPPSNCVTVTASFGPYIC